MAETKSEAAPEAEQPKPEQVLRQFLEGCISDDRMHGKRTAVMEARKARARKGRPSQEGIPSRCLEGEAIDSKKVLHYSRNGNERATPLQVLHREDVEQLTRDFGLDENAAQPIIEAADALLPPRPEKKRSPRKSHAVPPPQVIGDLKHPFIVTLEEMIRDEEMLEQRKQEMTERHRCIGISGAKSGGHICVDMGRIERFLAGTACPKPDEPERITHDFRMSGRLAPKFIKDGKDYITDFREREQALKGAKAAAKAANGNGEKSKPVEPGPELRTARVQAGNPMKGKAG